MATITKRERKDGGFSFRAEIRIKRGNKTIHSEGKTFSRQALAKKWAARRELQNS